MLGRASDMAMLFQMHVCVRVGKRVRYVTMESLTMNSMIARRLPSTLVVL
jgi:hypothetical protein